MSCSPVRLAKRSVAGVDLALDALAQSVALALSMPSVVALWTASLSSDSAAG